MPGPGGGHSAPRTAALTDSRLVLGHGDPSDSQDLEDGQYAVRDWKGRFDPGRPELRHARQQRCRPEVPPDQMRGSSESGMCRSRPTSITGPTTVRTFEDH